MIWNLVPIVALLMFVGAIVLEFAFRNESRRPLSWYSLNRRRWDDPNNNDRSDVSVPGSLVGSGMMLGHQIFYRITRDPAKQAKLLGRGA